MFKYFVCFTYDAGISNRIIKLERPIEHELDLTAMTDKLYEIKPDAKDIVVINYILMDQEDEHV